MLISDVIKETGLTRKAIYFYEEKGLICPTRDENTGIRTYDRNHIDRLTTILRLRELDMPLSAIQNIFKNPHKAEFILQKHIGLLQNKLNDVVSSIGKLNTIMNNFPPNGDLANFQNAADIVMPRTVQSELDYKFKGDIPVGYVRRITMQLYEAFLDLPLDSMERWNAWHNLLDKVEENCTEELFVACETLFGSWDLECIYQDFRLRKDLVFGYTKFTYGQYISKTNEIIQRLQELVSNKKQREKWLDYYWNFICPVLNSSDQELEGYIKSLSSVYTLYHGSFRKLVHSYLRPFMISSEGIALRKQLKEVLGDAYSENITIITFFDFYNNTINLNHLVK